MYVYKILFFFPLICNSFIHLNIKKNLNTNLYCKKINNNNKINKNKFPIIYKPKGVNQLNYLNYLNDIEAKLIIVLGPAGTGKTLFACQKAIQQLMSLEIDKIIITRPIVTVEEDIGFLPGNLIKKMDPWTKPIFDIFLEYCSKIKLDQLLNNGKIEICPLAFMRGRTFKNAFIIADEMQNSSPNQMKMLTTRLGDNCKMVVTGDLQQSDIRNENGLNDITKKINHYNIKNINNTKLIKIIEMTNNDIERSEIVKNIINIYNFKEKINITNTTSANTTSANTTSANTTSANTTSANTTSANTTSANTTSANTRSANTTSANTTSVNTRSANTTSANNFINNDAALIPKNHMSKYNRNYDIFFNSLDI